MYLGANSIYVISLNRLTERKKHMLNVSKQLECEFNLIEGYDHLDYEGNLSFINNHLSDTFFDSTGYLTLGVLCCALSHRKAWKHFLDSGDDLGLFLEDDVYPTEYITQYNFEEVKQQLDNLNWGVCWYGKHYDDIEIDKSITNNIAKITSHLPYQYVAHSYLLNRKSAQWFYDNTSKIKYPTDIQLEMSPFDQVCLHNSIFKQGKDQHDVEKINNELINSNTVLKGNWDSKTHPIGISSNFIPMDIQPKKLIVNNKIISGVQFTKINNNEL